MTLPFCCLRMEIISLQLLLFLLVLHLEDFGKFSLHISHNSLEYISNDRRLRGRFIQKRGCANVVLTHPLSFSYMPHAALICVFFAYVSSAAGQSSSEQKAVSLPYTDHRHRQGCRLFQ